MSLFLIPHTSSYLPPYVLPSAFLSFVIPLPLQRSPKCSLRFLFFLVSLVSSFLFLLRFLLIHFSTFHSFTCIPLFPFLLFSFRPFHLSSISLHVWVSPSPLFSPPRMSPSYTIFATPPFIFLFPFLPFRSLFFLLFPGFLSVLNLYLPSLSKLLSDLLYVPLLFLLLTSSPSTNIAFLVCCS